jgi:hypothetical protein
MGKTKKKQLGGIFLKKTAEESIIDFITNSSIVQILSIGQSGIIFQAILPPGIESPYEIFRSTNHKTPVTTIIIKLVAVSPINNDALGAVSEWYYDLERKYMNVESKQSFINEINMQTDIFLNTVNYLEPICPAPIYGDIKKTKEDANKFINLMYAKTRAGGTTQKILDIIKKRINYGQIPSLGIFGMEIANGYVTLHSCYHDGTPIDEVRKFECMARLEYIRLALQTGYSQNDWHSGNILVNKTVTGFYKDIPGHVLIIDFGMASKIPNDKLDNMRELVRAGNYSDAFQIFDTLTRPDAVKINTHPTFYGWITNKYDNVTKTAIQPFTDAELNQRMIHLKQLKQEAINERITKFNSATHNGDRENWPHLPLSPEMKNKLFSGMLVGGRNKKKRYRSKICKKTRKKKSRSYKLLYKKLKG